MDINKTLKINRRQWARTSFDAKGRLKDYGGGSSNLYCDGYFSPLGFCFDQFTDAPKELLDVSYLFELYLYRGNEIQEYTSKRFDKILSKEKKKNKIIFDFIKNIEIGKEILPNFEEKSSIKNIKDIKEKYRTFSFTSKNEKILTEKTKLEKLATILSNFFKSKEKKELERRIFKESIEKYKNDFIHDSFNLFKETGKLYNIESREELLKKKKEIENKYIKQYEDLIEKIKEESKANFSKLDKIFELVSNNKNIEFEIKAINDRMIFRKADISPYLDCREISNEEQEKLLSEKMIEYFGEAFGFEEVEFI